MLPFMSHSAVRPLPPLVGQVGLELEIALCVGGVITPPWGLPRSLSLTFPSSITPAFSHCLTSFSTRRSEIRRPRSCIRMSWSIVSK